MSCANASKISRTAVPRRAAMTIRVKPISSHALMRD